MGSFLLHVVLLGCGSCNRRVNRNFANDSNLSFSVITIVCNKEIRNFVFCCGRNPQISTATTSETRRQLATNWYKWRFELFASLLFNQAKLNHERMEKKWEKKFFEYIDFSMNQFQTHVSENVFIIKKNHKRSDVCHFWPFKLNLVVSESTSTDSFLKSDSSTALSYVLTRAFIASWILTSSVSLLHNGQQYVSRRWSVIPHRHALSSMSGRWKNGLKRYEASKLSALWASRHLVFQALRLLGFQDTLKNPQTHRLFRRRRSWNTSGRTEKIQIFSPNFISRRQWWRWNETFFASV